MTLLDQLRRRGELLATAARQLPKPAFRRLLIQHGIKFDDAIHCISVYLFWTDIEEAEHWRYRSGQPPPTSGSEVIALLIRWYRSGSPLVGDESVDDA